MSGAITNQVNRNLTQNILPQIGSGAVAAGGYGGSRQGIAEGNAIGQTNQDLSNSLANLYGQNYQQDQANDITRMGVLGNLGLGNQQQNYNFYTQNRQLDQSGAALGANLFNQGVNSQFNPIQNAGNIFSQFSGLGGGVNNTQNGSTLGAITGGAVLGSQLLGNLGLGSNKNAYIPPAYQTAGQYNYQNGSDIGWYPG